MRTPAEVRRHWLPALAGAAIVVAVLVMFFSLSRPPTTVLPASAPARPAIELARASRANELLAEEAAMRDLTPLFLPTERNVAPKKLEVREPGDRFLDVQAPQLLFSNVAPPIGRTLPPGVTVNGKPPSAARAMDALGSDAPSAPLFGFGRGQAETGAIGARGAFIEIVALASGQRVDTFALDADARPDTEQAWQPLEFLVVVDAAGLVERPTLVTGSRVPEVDQHFQNYLVRRLRIGDRLPPGFYRITLGP